MELNIQDLPFDIILILLSMCNSEDVFSILQAIPSFKNAYLMCNSYVKKCDVSNYCLWDESHQKFVKNFIRSSKSIREVNCNYAPKIVVTACLQVKSLTKLSMFGVNLTYEDLQMLLKFPELRETSFELAGGKNDCKYDIMPVNSQMMKTFDEISTSMKRINVFFPKCNNNGVLLFIAFFQGCPNVTQVNLSSHKNIQLMHALNHILDTRNEFFARYLTIGKVNAVFRQFGAISAYEESPKEQKSIRDTHNRPRLLRMPYMSKMIFNKQLFVSLEDIQYLKAGSLEVQDVVLYNGGIVDNFPLLLNYRRLPYVNINNFFFSLPSLRSFHCFLNCKMDYKFLLSRYSKLDDLTLTCSEVHEKAECKEVCDFIVEQKGLKYLCIPTCILQDTPVPEKRKNFVVKKPRISYQVNSSEEEIPFNEVLKNCTKLERLEILQQRHAKTCEVLNLNYESLNNIGNLHLLQHLLLSNIRTVKSDLFVSIAAGCPLLLSLKLKYLGPCYNRCSYLNDLAAALPMFKKLQDFSWQQNYILPCNIIFEALKLCKNLRRLFIKNERDNTKIAIESFVSLLTCSERIHFAYFVFDTTSQLKWTIKRQLRANVPRHLKWGIVLSSEEREKSEHIIPTDFFGEMCMFRPWVLNRIMFRC